MMGKETISELGYNDLSFKPGSLARRMALQRELIVYYITSFMVN